MRSYRESAFSGFEIIFILTAIGIIVANFFILTYVSPKNNTITKNFATAAKLVQESVKEMVYISGGGLIS